MQAAQQAPQPVPAAMLTDFEAAHSKLLDAMAELDRICRNGVPDRTTFTNIRWKLSGASLVRRMLWARILGHLLPLVGERAAADLRRLQDRDIELLRASTRHVGRWSTEDALADWPGYCRASRALRAQMLAAIQTEQQIVYPLLRRLSGAMER